MRETRDTFDLSELLELAPVHDATRSAQAMEKIQNDALSFYAHYESRLSGMNDVGWAEALAQYESIITDANRLQRAAQVLMYQERTPQTEANHKAFSEFNNEIKDKLGFVKKTITAMHGDEFKALEESPQLERYNHWMKYIREVERVDATPELQADIREAIEDYKRLNDTIPEEMTPEQREKKATEVAASYDKAVGLWQEKAEQKGYNSILGMQLGQDQVSEELLNNVMTAATENLAATHNYHTWKTQQQGKASFTFDDIGEPPPPVTEDVTNAISWDLATKVIPRVYNDLDPKMGAIAAKVFEKGHIDGRNHPEGKEGWDQCVLVEGTKGPAGFVFMHFDPESPNALGGTLHEVAHAIHAEMSSGQPNALYGMDYSMPPPLLEMYAVFGQRYLLDAQLKHIARTPQEEQQITTNFIEEQMWFSTTCLAYHQFETAIHEAKSNGETLNKELLSEKWEKAHKAAFGDNLQMDEEAKLGWMSYDVGNYIVETPGYAYSYVLDTRLAEMLHQKYEQDPQAFCERYKAMQEAGQSLPMAELLHQHMGINISDPQVWRDVEQSRNKMFETAKGTTLQQELPPMPSWAARVSQQSYQQTRSSSPPH